MGKNPNNPNTARLHCHPQNLYLEALNPRPLNPCTATPHNFLGVSVGIFLWFGPDIVTDIGLGLAWFCRHSSEKGCITSCRIFAFNNVRNDVGENAGLGGVGGESSFEQLLDVANVGNAQVST